MNIHIHVSIINKQKPNFPISKCLARHKPNAGETEQETRSNQPSKNQARKKKFTEGNDPDMSRTLP